MGSGKKQKGKGPRGRGAPATKPPRQPRAFAAGITTADALDTLLHERYHGAANIRGIRFQVRFAMLRAVEMAHAARAATPGAFAVAAAGATGSVQGVPAMIAGASTDPMRQPLLRMEGIEDVDVADPSLGPLRVVGQTHAGGEYVQVKTAVSSWNWSKLKEPLLGWIELYRTGAAGVTFRLVVNFELAGDLALLARFLELSGHQQKDIRRKFRQLGAKLGATDAEADGAHSCWAQCEAGTCDPTTVVCCRLPGLAGHVTRLC